jgi:arginase
LELDAIDLKVAPGVGPPVPDELACREARLIMELLSDCRKITSLDIVEVNPMFDNTSRTAELAVDLTASLMGRLSYGLTKSPAAPSP